MKLKIFLSLSILFLATSIFAQQNIVSGRVLFRITPGGISAFRAAFASPETYQKTFDPQKFSLRDVKVISNLFSFPDYFHPVSLKPFIPQHNVVLEALRERTNPGIFRKVNSNGIAPNENDAIIQLRAAEEKISRWFELFFDTNQSVQTAISLLTKSGIIEVAEPRYRSKLCYTPNDPLYGQQYSLPQIFAPQAWDSVRCDSTMIVADDDIGADWTHPDLANAAWINSGETGLDSNGFDKRSNGIDDDGDGFVDDWHGWDFAGSDGTTPDNDPNTSAQHGTHTSGIMAASGNNGIGICGVAFGSRVIILKCADDYGQDVAFGYEGIVYAADHGAKVVNNSWGGSNRTQSGEDIVTYARKKDCVVSAASGNGGSQESADGKLEGLYPALYDHVLSVAATDQSGRLTDFSNYNQKVTVSAPGYNVLSTVPGNQYTLMSGTSMASPTAAGGIAIVRQRFPLLSGDQAIERLRATSDTLTSDQNLHPGFTGKGRINLYRAVKQSPVYSARIDSVEIHSPNGSGYLLAGETGDVIVHVRNYLDPVTNLTAKIELVNDAGHYLSTNFTSITFGKANTLEVVQNYLGSFLLLASPNTPQEYSVLVKLTFQSVPEGYGPDVDYFTVIVNRGYADLNKNNITVSFDAKGNIGYADPPGNAQGSGFLWNNTSIVPLGRSVLSNGGLMVGSGPGNLAAAAYGSESDQLAEQDFTPVQPITQLATPDKQNALQELAASFADSIPDSFSEAGVTVTLNAYEFSGDLASNAVVIDYGISKRAIDTGSGKTMYSTTDSSAAALFMDWDIGSSGALNLAYISSLDSLVGITRRLEDGYPYIGMKIISPVPSGSSVNIYALDNNGAGGSAKTYNGFSMTDKWLTMTTSRSNAGIGDVSMVYGLKNLPLLSQPHVHLTYVIAMAENESLLKQTIDQTAKAWNGTGSAAQRFRSGNDISIFPNPFTSRIEAQWNSENPEAYQLEISDALGRIVLSKSGFGNTVMLSGLHLLAGTYIVSIRQGTFHYRTSVVSVE